MVGAAVVVLAAGWGVGRWSASASSSSPPTTHPSQTPPTTTSAPTTVVSPPASTAPAVASAPAGRARADPHVPRDHQPPAGTALPELFLPADQFDAQMRYLKLHGFHPVTLAQVWTYWTRGATLPVHPIVLSFDDGYRSQFTAAARTLHRYGWPGVLNLIVAHLHEGTYGLGAHEVSRMIAWGWELDSHTLTHPDLTTVHGAGTDRRGGGLAAHSCSTVRRPGELLLLSRRGLGRRGGERRQGGRLPAATTTNEGVADPSQGRSRSTGSASTARARSPSWLRSSPHEG